MAKTLFTILIILILGAAAKAETPESEYDRLRRENRELRKKLLAGENEIKNYRIWLASLGIDFRKSDAGEREKRLLYILEELAKRGNILSMSALTVSDECRKLLAELPVGPAKKTRIELRLDELERAAAALAGLTIPNDAQAGSCRILAVDNGLQAVVLSAGAGAGVFPGMVFHAKSKPELKFRVIGARFEGSVAELAEGNWQDVVPGMEMSAFQKVKENNPLIRR
ncbi:MAG: hypothetical protein IJC27_05875 [Lentisphaeria bacterium]|nr:hypothetical protein [Lentisphaeria bacterium]